MYWEVDYLLSMSKEPTKNKKDNDPTWGLVGGLLLSIAFIGYGIIMIVNGIYRASVMITHC